MTKEIFPTIENKSDMTDFLSQVSNVKEEDIRKFRDQQLLQEKQKDFDEIDHDVKLKIVALAGLSPDNLNNLKNVCVHKRFEYIPGFHDLEGCLALLYRLTKDTSFRID